jgi:hypothetical protein
MPLIQQDDLIIIQHYDLGIVLRKKEDKLYPVDENSERTAEYLIQKMYRQLKRTLADAESNTKKMKLVEGLIPLLQEAAENDEHRAITKVLKESIEELDVSSKKDVTAINTLIIDILDLMDTYGMAPPTEGTEEEEAPRKDPFASAQSLIQKVKGGNKS